MIRAIEMDELRQYEMNENYRIGRKPGVSSQDVMEFLCSQDAACEIILPKGASLNTVRTSYQNSIKRYGNNQIHLRSINDKIFMVKSAHKKPRGKRKVVQPELVG